MQMMARSTRMIRALDADDGALDAHDSSTRYLDCSADDQALDTLDCSADDWALDTLDCSADDQALDRSAGSKHGWQHSLVALDARSTRSSTDGSARS